MSDKVYLGLKAGTLETAETLSQVSRINLSIDSGNMYTSGTDDGRTVEVSIPWGTQAMADHILSGLKNVTYRPYTAEQALLDPAAEIGDGITVGGIYSAIYQTGISFDRQMATTVSAPASDETEDEYPYQSKARRKANRQLAQTRSSITKTAAQIMLEVANEVENLSSSFSVELGKITARVDDAEGSIEVAITTLDGLTVTDSTGTTKIKGSSVETDTLYVSAAHITGTLSASQVELTGSISWTDLATDAQNQVSSAQNMSISAYNLANTANNTASSVSNAVSAWTYPGTTYIDGSMLMTGTVIASTLQGGTISILNNYGTEIGYMSVGSSTSTGLQLVSGGNLYLASASCDIQMMGSYMSVSCSSFYPRGSGANLGDSSLGMWQAVYSYTGTIQTSDLTKKHDVIYGLDAYDEFFDSLRPISFLFDDGTSGRRHHGLGAQDVEQALLDCGLTSMDFAGLIKSPRLDDDGHEIDGEYDYALRYAEFIPMLIDQLQRLKRRVKELEGNL